MAASQRSVALATFLLPPMTPALGIEWLRCAKLLSHLGRLAEAVDAWRNARRILSITHGGTSKLVRRLNEDCKAAESELNARGGGRGATTEDDQEQEEDEDNEHDE